MTIKTNVCTALARPVTGLARSLALAAALALGVPAAAADVHLTFGTYTAEKPTATLRKFKPVLRVLEELISRRLGEPVRIRTQIAASYGRGIDDLVSGTVDFARFGPASYITAKARQSGISLLAMEAVDGSKTFNGVICVRADSDIHDVAGLRGRSFAFGSKLSTIGRFLSQKKLLDAGITGRDLERFDYLDRHDRVGMAVANGEFDAGALKESTFNEIQEKTGALRAISVFPNVTKPWIARADLDPRVRQAIASVLMSFDDRSALDALNSSGFVAADDADFDVIRAAIEDSDLFGG